ncbi:MAG: glucose-6-phosphate isomerase [Gammaproteobacteria bacterium]|nr:glucose-6-phosphate isomerase [Gammaproteobacteria bacterium]
MTVAEKVQIRESIAGISFFLSCAPDSSKLDADCFGVYLKRFFSGEIVNESEQRAATHTAFRDAAPNEIVKSSLSQIKEISEKIRQNHYFFPVTDVVNIGIGGSDLGPKLICEAFVDEITGPRVHFVSNLDAEQIQLLLKQLPPSNTLFIVTSKSFRTLETLENMRIARTWLSENGIDGIHHFIAVTGNSSAAVEKKIPSELILTVPESVGGRYSIWSAVGLPCAIAFGFEKFYQLHQGAREMDTHFISAEFEENMPVIYASQLYDALASQLKTLAILPYSHRLRALPEYLQQLFMESLGKRVNTNGECVHYSTGPIVFGSTGTNSQHSFQQLMMQGTHPIFADFILPLNQNNADEKTQAKMISNCLTQVKTLRSGVAHPELLKTIPGEKCANLFVLEKCDLKTLGALIAFYEHAVVTLAFMLKINPFDQWGVEYAKRESEQLSKRLNDGIPSIAQIREILD